MATNKTIGGLMLMSLYNKKNRFFPLSLILIIISLFIPTLSLASSIDNNYKLGAGDKITIVVYGENDLSISELLISSSGAFDYPYLGQLRAKGKTPKELKERISNGLKGDYLINPKVMVNIISFRKIYVNGEVKRPGGYEFQPGLTVDKAIALAGGFTDRASRSSIKLKQADNDRVPKKANLDTEITPGDIIIIEQSFF